MRRWLAILAVALALLVVIGKGVSTVYAEWQWHVAMGSLAVYRSALTQDVLWRAGAASTAFAFAFANLYALRRSIVSLVLPRRLGNIEIGEAVSARMLLAYVIGVSACLGVLLSSPVSDWSTLTLARIAEPFHEFDPFLDRDLSFAVARLPLQLDLHAWAARVMIVVSVLIATLYALTPSLRVRHGRLYVSVYCRRHLAVLAAVALLLVAWRWRLDGVSLTSLTPEAGGPYTIYWHRVGRPLLAWLAVMTAISAFVVLWTGWYGYGRVAAFTTVAAALGGPVVAGALPRLTVRSMTEASLREEDRPYANTRRLFTRRAFGVDVIDSARGGSAVPRTAADMIRGIPVWDPGALVRSIPGVGNAADSARVAWAPDVAGIQALVVARRPGSASEWTLASLDAASAGEGGRLLPALPVEGAASPPAGWANLLVYPGARTPLVLADTGGHVPAPPFTSWWQRVALAWSERTPRLVGAEAGDVRPKLAYHRDVRDRLHELVPFLTAGPTIMPLVRGDSLYWVVELFTTSSTYPLSDRLFFAGQEYSYVHHAATAYVQAMTGAVTLVATARPDAIMRAWMRQFPALFLREGDVAASIASIHAPVVDWAILQATALARTGSVGDVGTRRAAVGADNADADLAAGGPTQFAWPRGGPLAWSTPVVDAAGFVTGIVVADGGAHPRTYWVRAHREDRWADVLDALQRAADSAGIGRRRAGSRRGHVLAIPVAGGIAFTQSHYEWSPGGPPAFVGASAFANGAAKAGATLSAALGIAAMPSGGSPANFRSAVDALYQRMSDALRRGDWPAFGAAFSALGRLVREARNP